MPVTLPASAFASSQPFRHRSAGGVPSFAGEVTGSSVIAVAERGHGTRPGSGPHGQGKTTAAQGRDSRLQPASPPCCDPASGRPCGRGGCPVVIASYHGERMLSACHFRQAGWPFTR